MHIKLELFGIDKATVYGDLESCAQYIVEKYELIEGKLTLPKKEIG